MNSRQYRQKKNRRRTTYRSKLKQRRQTVFLYRAGSIVMVALVVVLLGYKVFGNGAEAESNRTLPVKSGNSLERPDLDVQLLTVNQYSRPGTAMPKINGIVIHYTANPGTTAQNNRDYFEGLKDSGAAKVSSHFVVGMEGEVIQCIPSAEISYASNDRNWDTLSIECCHPDESGGFTDATYRSLVEMTAWLCQEFGVDTSGILRHYDVTGKACPKYYVDHEDEWQQFLEDVGSLL